MKKLLKKSLDLRFLVNFHIWMKYFYACINFCKSTLFSFNTLSRIVLISSFLIMFSFNSFSSFALGLETLTPEADIKALKTELSEKLQNQAISYCAPTLQSLYDLELQEFLSFLDMHYKNKSSNTSLNNIAIARYVDFKKNIESYFNQLHPGFVDDDTTEGIQELHAYEVCSAISDTYIDLAKERMIQHIKNSTAQKKTMIMLDKYKSINEKMRDLHMQVSKMYGLINTFKAKLPGFISQCITK